MTWCKTRKVIWRHLHKFADKDLTLDSHRKMNTWNAWNEDILSQLQHTHSHHTLQQTLLFHISNWAMTCHPGLTTNRPLTAVLGTSGHREEGIDKGACPGAPLGLSADRPRCSFPSWSISVCPHCTLSIEPRPFYPWFKVVVFWLETW